MTRLLGLDPPVNPNDAGEEQQDWRQLVGFQDLRGRRHQRQNNDDHNAEAHAQAQVNGNGEAATPRRTRISWELHQIFELDEEPPRAERQQRGYGRGGENQNGEDDEE